MSDEQNLTMEEAQEVADIINNVITMTVLALTPLRDQTQADLVRRGLDEVANHQNFLSAASVAYLAAGVDVLNEPLNRNIRRNIPVMRKCLELRDLLVQNEQEALQDAKRDQERDLLRHRLGL